MQVTDQKHKKPSVWDQLDRIKSIGSQTRKANSLGDLHRVRKETNSQFWTPLWLSHYIWGLINQIIEPNERYTFLDNSVGAASLFRGADPDSHGLYGFDIDNDVIGSLKSAFMLRAREYQFENIRLERARIGKFSIATINPPFSINFDSPYLEANAVTHYGRYGRDTSARSDEYALAQALKSCQVVFAIVPRSVTKLFKRIEPRLEYVLKLPRDTFVDETVESVEVDLLVFGPRGSDSKPIEESISQGQEPFLINRIPVLPPLSSDNREAFLEDVSLKHRKPLVTTPVTGDTQVSLIPNDRKIDLKFRCGATEARVLNEIYEQPILSVENRKPIEGIEFVGEFRLLIDVIILQDDVEEALDFICNKIRSAGGNPVITTELRDRIKELQYEHERMSVPFSRYAYRKEAPIIQAKAKKLGLIDLRNKNSFVMKGESVSAKRTENGFEVTSQQGKFNCEHDTFFAYFDIGQDYADEGYWEQIHPPIRDKFPDEIAALEKRAIELGVMDWLTWRGYQGPDLIEIAFKDKGALVAWQMALGKTRLALALSFLLEGNSLILVKPRLVNEIRRELAKLGVPQEDFNIIESESDIENLKKVNIASYNTIKSRRTQSGKSIACLISDRIENCIADEGGLLANEHTAQTLAVKELNSKRNYIFDGTPQPNTCRELHIQACWIAGESRSYQPYGNKGVFIEKSLFYSPTEFRRGRDAFREDFVKFEWVTNEFIEEQKGAKREIPTINGANLHRFREWISPLMKRRVQLEPDVAAWVQFPVPIINPPTIVEWDAKHLEVYIKAVKWFEVWYEDYLQSLEEDGKVSNLTVILQKLEACFKAANVPDTLSGFCSPYLDLTSKQKAVIDFVCDQVTKGNRPIVFARSPKALKRMAIEIEKRGVSTLLFTGEETIEKRNQKLDAQLREGDVQSVLASIGVTCDGLNLEMLNTFIFYNRDFRGRSEFQAMYRLLRADQRNEVNGYFFHLPGSIDEYQAQLLDYKAMASEAGLDYGEQPPEDEFLSFDVFFKRFIQSLPELESMYHQIIKRGYRATA